MPPLTLQIHHNDRGWLDAAQIDFSRPGKVRLDYDVDYASEFIGRADRQALSVLFAVDLSLYEGPVPAFILDLLPQGEPLKRLLRRYGLSDDAPYDVILATAPLAPPGNIRVKEPWAEIEKDRAGYSHPGFSLEEITHGNRDFADYMEASGAPIGGTSGAVGGSPKFLLREDERGRFHAEGWLDDRQTERAYLVKLPYTDSENSRMLARVEKAYYDILRELPLVRTGDAIAIRNDTLFIKRFDREREAGAGRLLYHGLESFYSARGVNMHGARLSHEDNLLLLGSVSTEKERDVLDYLARDVLNQMLANTDNHGRNTSFLKKDGLVTLSPVYDVTAMQFFTADFITELTRWDASRPSWKDRIDWCATATGISGDVLRGGLRELARHTQGLEKRMLDLGVPLNVVEGSRALRRRVQAEMEGL